MKKFIKWLYFKFVYNQERENEEYLKLRKEFEELRNKNKQ